MKARKIEDLLAQRHQRFTPLQRLIRHSAHQSWQTTTVRALLAPDLASAVDVVNYREGKLTLSVVNASLATRLRYLLPELTASLATLADFGDLETIRLVVRHSPPQQSPELESRELSPAAAERLAELAATLRSPEYASLQQAVLRLREHSPSEAHDGHTDPPPNDA
ncbi:MAG: DUF721 domain-containing protein [Pseudomonadota bacterium]